MNYSETLAYWYLRFNGFFLIQNFVLHPLADSEGSDKQAADIDLLAVRFPYVYEETGGQPDDWDPKLRIWGFAPEEEIIGLIVEVKTSPHAESAGIQQNSFNHIRIRQAVQRLGMFQPEDAKLIADELKSIAVATRRGPYHVGKLLFSHSELEGGWRNITLLDAEWYA